MRVPLLIDPCLIVGSRDDLTTNRILEWPRPQNSAHCAWNVPRTFGVHVNVWGDLGSRLV